MKVNIDQKVQELQYTPSDINEHFSTILRIGSECKHITELGVRWIVSTWGWLATKPDKLVCYDIADPSHWGANIQDVYDTAKELGVDFTFTLADDLKIEIEETDLLFIDTEHTYEQLSAELKLHGNKARKYLTFHDTTLPPLRKAIKEFMDENPHWIVKEDHQNNNGFMVLKRI